MITYTQEEIRTVLWNVFNLEADAIEFIDDNGGQYIFKVFPTEDTKLGTLSDMAQDLFDSDLFDVTMKGDHLEIEFLNPYVMSRESFTMVRENIAQWISFDDTQVKNMEKRFNMVHIKYHNNPFYISVMKQLKEKKKLSKKQFDELKHLIETGQTRYEAGVLTTKN